MALGEKIRWQPLILVGVVDGMHLVGVDLVGADLVGVDLVGADLVGASLVGVDLHLDMVDLGKEEDLVTMMIGRNTKEDHHNHHQHLDDGTDQASVHPALVQVSLLVVACRHSQQVAGVQEFHQGELHPQAIIQADSQRRQVVE
jgi:hypothetical protein